MAEGFRGPTVREGSFGKVEVEARFVMPHPKLEKPNILIIDDDEQIRS